MILAAKHPENQQKSAAAGAEAWKGMPQNLIIQHKLSVGKEDDEFEREADNTADRVMRMPETNFVQRKCDKCEEEEKLQRKTVTQDPNPLIQAKANGSSAVSESVANSIQSSRGNGAAIDRQTQSFMANRMDSDFSEVKIHTNSEAVQLNRELNAKAFTVGNDIYFNEGQYQSGSEHGKRLLAHELTHVLQQGGSKIRAKEKSNLIQRYFDANGNAGSAIGHSYRISDDLTAAVKVGYPNHELYAEAGKAAISNSMLASVGSGIKLIEESTTFNVAQGSTVKTLRKVVPENVRNLTSGDTMKVSDDCGTSCSVVVGSDRRTALHYDAITKTNARTMATTPSLMKAEIMKKMLVKWLINASTSAPLKVEIVDTIVKAEAKQLEIIAARAAYAAATTAADKETKNDIYWAKVDEYGNIMMSFYNRMPEANREEVDKYLEINKFVNPNVGQGYTMSSGGANYPGQSTWNFHWGGVVMKSSDQQDTITLENYAVPGNVENDKWDFAMYGTAAKKGQTFHEQHQGTKQHGDRPTTMKIEKQ